VLKPTEQIGIYGSVTIRARKKIGVPRKKRKEIKA